MNIAGVLSDFKKMTPEYVHGTIGGYPCPWVKSGIHPVYGGTVIVLPFEGRFCGEVLTPTEV